MDDGRRGIRQTRKRVLPSKAGKIRCLGICGRYFMSPDRVRIRICQKCKGNRERMGLIGENDSTVHGVDIPEADDE